MTDVKCGRKTNNPFFNFLRCYRTRPENMQKSAAEVSVRGAREWNKLDEDERKPFVEMALPFLKPKKPRTSRAKSTTRARRTTRRTRRSTTRRGRPTTRGRRRATRSVQRRPTTSRRRPVKRTSRRSTSRRRAPSRRKPARSSRPRGRPRKMPSCANCAQQLQRQSEQVGTSSTTAPNSIHNTPLNKTTMSPLKTSPETPSPRRCELMSKVLADCDKTAPFANTEVKTEQPDQGKSCVRCGRNSSQSVLVSGTGLRQGCSLVDKKLCPCCEPDESSDSDSSEITVNCNCAETQRKFNS